MEWIAYVVVLAVCIPLLVLVPAARAYAGIAIGLGLLYTARAWRVLPGERERLQWEILQRLQAMGMAEEEAMRRCEAYFKSGAQSASEMQVYVRSPFGESQHTDVVFESVKSEAPPLPLPQPQMRMSAALLSSQQFLAFASRRGSESLRLPPPQAREEEELVMTSVDSSTVADEEQEPLYRCDRDTASVKTEKTDHTRG
ncbi:hypothetical protein, conserved [Angomonas deanei]|uniref:Uncharacterized protein n=1 Tax=Angomonas deanei TaxID=59799 RepID=A0A7G2CMY5_9TRYP|nr:hypothetical protein, conserved [Angomonas deanei]